MWWWFLIALAPLWWVLLSPGSFISFVMCVVEGLRRGNATDDRIIPRWPGESRLNYARRFWRFQRYYDRKYKSGAGTGLEIAIVRLGCGDCAHIYANNSVAADQTCLCLKHGPTKIAEVSVVLTLDCGHLGSSFQCDPVEVGQQCVCHRHDPLKIVRITAVNQVSDNIFDLLTMFTVADAATSDSKEANPLMNAHWGGW
jgi:hypothetical protein